MDRLKSILVYLIFSCPFVLINATGDVYKQYDYQNYPIRFVGSVAYSYADILRDVAEEFGVTLETIEETPMPGLIEFHALNIEEV